MILRQEKVIADKAQRGSGDADDRFYINILKMELERVKFVFKSYLRTRLLKIERNYLYIVEKDQSDLLSEAEQEFAFAIHQSREKHYNESFLTKVPPKYNHLDGETVPDHMCKSS